MTENKRFEFREVNCTAIVPRIYDTKKQQYANLFECVHWLNDLHKENERVKEERNYFERKKCEYFNKYNKKHLNNIQLRKENEQLKQKLKGDLNEYG